MLNLMVDLGGTGPLLLLGLFYQEARADTGESVPCQEDDRARGASLREGACLGPDLVRAMCQPPMFTEGTCPTWEEVVASPVDALLEDCGEGSDIAHRASLRPGPEDQLTFGFNVDGLLVSGEHTLFNGLPWCCKGGSSYTLQAGLVEPTCLDPVRHVPETDTASREDVDSDGEDLSTGCGCGSPQRRGGLLLGGLAVAWMLAVRRAPA